ncbi:MAG TPA: hypothetical protein P5279_02960 [Anaerohalosphaeraceae bacterium]|jgi:hypothetical protein|nr:hypothetical protein [Anaerohalosphaeraceae bacterium]HRT49429.1 hypothetical protein [Anaerohalosphaeraceae bacterium]HRT85407.1 hypothetical protein [Anaerohalosphaeraceae bacterium]
MNTIKHTPSIVLVLLALASTSCTYINRSVLLESGHYYVDPATDFTHIARVVVFELDNLSVHPEVGPLLTDALGQAFRKRHLFTLRTIGPDDADWQNLDLSRTSAYSLEELAAIREQLNADAVVFGAIQQYQPYPHLLTGLHLRMVDLRHGRVIWAMEQVWDSSDKTVELRLKRYFETQMRSGYEPLNWQVFLASPRAFDKFVAAEVARTLPGPPALHRIDSASENPLALSENLPIRLTSTENLKKP